MGHFYQDKSYYFLTGRTFTGKHYFDTPEKKQILFEQFKTARERLEIKIFAYAILSNHHHGVYYVEKGKDIANIMQYLHGGSTYRVNKNSPVKRSIWQGYWEVWIHNEKMLWSIIGYVIGNPLKHKVVKNFEELENYSFCSYQYMVERRGKEFAEELVKAVIAADFETKEACEKYFAVK